jgi:long-chain acyl-CoA synthetase
VRGKNVSTGYWNSNGESITDEQGWVHTGDIGEFGPGGNIYFRGRSKETIVTAAGLKIYPTDLEAALDRQPEIKASAVIPLAGAKGTEALAVVIPRDEHADVNAGVQRANDSLAEFQRIRHWIVWPASDFPRTPGTRKVIKNQIADAVKTMLKEPSTSGASDSKLAPLSLPVISRITRVEPTTLTASANLAGDLKLDSLGRVELLSALEDQYQIELDEAAITEATTIADIERIVSRGKSEAVAYPYPRWAMRLPFRLIRFVVYHVFLLPLTLVMCRVRVIGVDRFANVKPPVLFISNHVTDVDAGLILSALPWRWRYRMAIAMAGEILREWRMNSKVTYALGAALFNVFPLPRQSGFRQSFAYAGEAVDRGFSILIFPEGTETKDGRIQPFKAGIGLLASELNVPIVPIMLRGLFEVKQRGQRFVKPGTVSVTFGEPVTFMADKTAAEITNELDRMYKIFQDYVT